MKPNKVFLVTFSPTHTSLRIGNAIVEGLFKDNVEIIDLTLVSEVSQINIDRNSIVVFSLPVYGGYVAPLAMQRLSNLKAEGSLAVIAAVYGNRAFDNALTQLDDFVTERGCRVIAAGGFIGEHSYSNSKYPIAAGRPDDDDIAYARSFGKNVIEKIEKAGDIEHTAVVKAKNLILPQKSEDYMMTFFSEIKQAMTSGVTFPKGPSTDASLCNNCGICVSNCPTQAIKPGEEDKTDYERCIKCCACIKLCPSKARSIDTPFSSLLNKYFAENKKNITLL